VVQRLARIAGFFKGAETSRRKRAIATLSGLVGVLTLARAVDDPALRKEILVAGQDPEGVARPERLQYRSVRGRMPVLSG